MFHFNCFLILIMLAFIAPPSLYDLENAQNS